MMTKKLLNEDSCSHEFESIGLLGVTGDIYKCKLCGKEVDMTEDDDL